MSRPVIVAFDDSKMHLQYLGIVLSETSCEYRPIHSNPKSAMDLITTLREIQPVIVILDFHTLTIEGDALVLRCRDAGIRCPFILYSSDDDVEAVATRCKADGWAKKGDNGKLRSLVKEMLAKYASKAHAAVTAV